MKFLAFILLFALTACMKNDEGPEAALKDFVDSRVGKVIDREFVMKRVSGKMLQSFKQMTPETFEQFADMKNIKADSLKILSKNCENDKCFLTYSVSYLTKNAEKTLFSSEVKKIAEMVQVEDKWLIADVSNILTYHESHEAINLLE